MPWVILIISYLLRFQTIFGKEKKINEVTYGDFISWSYDNPADHNGASGHFVFVYGEPELNAGWAELYVIDSSSGRHEPDTRALSCVNCGIGIGKMGFSYNTVTFEITAVYWRSISTEPVDGVGDIAIGHPLELPENYCVTRSLSWSNIPCPPGGCTPIQQILVNTLNTIGNYLTPWDADRTAYQNPADVNASSCTCCTPPSPCIPAPGETCTDNAFNCAWNGWCGAVYIFSSSLFPRYILRYGLGRYYTWPAPTGSSSWWDNWLQRGIGNTQPSTTVFHNYFNALPSNPTTPYYFQKIPFSDLKVGDIISFSSTKIFSGAHVMFALGAPFEITPGSKLYKVKVMDSIKTHEHHCQDSRRNCLNENCGVGWGYVYFQTDGSGNVVKFYWSGPWVNMPFTSFAFTRVIPPDPSHTP